MIETERSGGGFSRKRSGGAATRFLVRPGRVAAANDNVPVRSLRRRHVARRRITQAALICVALAAVLVVGACGRRGAPELPASAKNEQRVPLYATEPGGDEVPDRPFIGDKILQ